MYMMYLKSISTSSTDVYLSKLQQFTNEITSKEYNFNKIEDINNAISSLSKFRNVQRKNQNRFRLDASDYKREHNGMVVAIEGLSSTLFYKALNVSENEHSAIEKMKDDITSDSSSVKKFMTSYQIGEIELVKSLYELSNARMNSEALCKIIKNMVKRLHKRRSQLEFATI